MVIEVRIVIISGGVIPQRERSSRNIVYLDVGDGYMDLYKCESSSDYVFVVRIHYAFHCICVIFGQFKIS